jgi:prevent-host-death family protein
MKRVKIAEFKSQLSRHLRAVERGAEIEITDRDRPIARLVPVSRPLPSRLQPAELPVSALLRKRFRPARWRTSSLELLLEDRRRR